MKCTEYTHHYRWQPPDYYYYDCVGFTGYTTSVADPTAWSSVARRCTSHPGYVPTPLAFEGFFNNLATTPQPAGRPSPMWRRSTRRHLGLAARPARRPTDTSGVGHSVMPLVAPQPIAGSGGTRWESSSWTRPPAATAPTTRGKPGAHPLSERNAPILTPSG